MSSARRWYKLLSLLLSRRIQSTKPRLFLCLPQKAKWDDAIRVAAQEYILPALSSVIGQLGLERELPADIEQLLSSVHTLNLDRNHHIQASFEALVATLNRVHIEPVVLKGLAYLSTGIYRNLGDRYLTDIDILVAETQLVSAVEALTSEGYVLAAPDAGPRWHHHYPLLLSPGGVGVEVHHSLGLGVCRSILSAADTIRRSRPMDWGPLRFRVPCPEDLVTHHIMHSQVQHHFCCSVWPTLRSMYDFTLLTETFKHTLDWNLIEGRFRHSARKFELVMYILLVEQVLGMEKPFPIRLSALDRLRWCHRIILRAYPMLRYIDPFYGVSSIFSHRAHLIRELQSHTGGWRRLIVVPLRPRFYVNLFSYGPRYAVSAALGWATLGIVVPGIQTRR